MQARVTKVIPAHHEHARLHGYDEVAVMVTVSPGAEPVATSLFATPGTLTEGQVITVRYADPATPALGFRLA